MKAKVELTKIQLKFKQAPPSHLNRFAVAVSIPPPPLGFTGRAGEAGEEGRDAEHSAAALC